MAEEDDKKVLNADEARADNYWTNKPGDEPNDGIIKGDGVVGALKETPPGKVYEAISNLATGKGDMEAVVTEIGEFASAVPFSAFVDPFHGLLVTGLGFLVDLIKPLDDALKLVTGDPDQLENAATKFTKVAKDLKNLGTDFARTVDSGLATWHGEAAGKGHERLKEFAEGITMTSGEAESVVGLLEGSKALMQTAYDLVMDIIAALVEWLIITWLAAQAAAVPTLGGSEVAAAAATAVEVGVATTRVTKIVTKVTQLLQKISRVFKILIGRLGGPKWWQTTTKHLAGRDARKIFDQGGWKASAKVFGKDTASNAGQTLLESAIKDGAGVVGAFTDEPPDAGEINRKLTMSGELF